MEKSIKLHTIAKLDIIEGDIDFDFCGIVGDILNLKDSKVDGDLTSTHYEDSLCPDISIIDRISDRIKETFESVVQGLSLVETSRWSHIHEKNMSTNTHNHYPSDVSAVCYISVPPGSGNIVFLPHLNHRGEPNTIPFPPEEGKFFIFPGYLDHFVTRNNSTENRISLSFNYTLEQKHE